MIVGFAFLIMKMVFDKAKKGFSAILDEHD